MRAHTKAGGVIVNRFWSQFFGRGIVVTSDDFGSQGDWPEHPELLDWLACEFRDNGWDVKELVKLIVSSATYRQSSRSDPERIARDPENRLLARGPLTILLVGPSSGSVDSSSLGPRQQPFLMEQLFLYANIGGVLNSKRASS